MRLAASPTGCSPHARVPGDDRAGDGRDARESGARPSVEENDTVDAPDLEATVLACLEKDPAKRPQTADELAGMLSAARV
jgi:hypothetical protein